MNTMNKNDLPEVCIEELTITPPDEAVYKKVKENWDHVAKPLDSLGRFEAILAKVGAILGTDKLDIQKRAVIAMCADNGVVEEGISQSGQEITAMITECMGEQKSSVCKMAAFAHADVIPVDIGVNSEQIFPGVCDYKVARGTRNFAKMPAMTEEETRRAIAVGIEMVRRCKEEGYHLLATGEMGIGNTTTGSAVTAALTGCSVEEITGRGAGLDDQRLIKKKKVIQSALEKYELKPDEPLRILSCVGGFDIAGMAGVFIGGALYHIPIVLDGVISCAAALCAERLIPGVRDFMIPSHISKEPAARRIMQELGLEPVIDAGLALGEGTGAVMIFPLLDIALTLYYSDTTFGEICLEQYERFDSV